jgi:hypothetical protein
MAAQDFFCQRLSHGTSEGVQKMPIEYRPNIFAISVGAPSGAIHSRLQPLLPKNASLYLQQMQSQCSRKL